MVHVQSESPSPAGLATTINLQPSSGARGAAGDGEWRGVTVSVDRE